MTKYRVFMDVIIPSVYVEVDAQSEEDAYAMASNGADQMTQAGLLAFITNRINEGFEGYVKMGKECEVEPAEEVEG